MSGARLGERVHDLGRVSLTTIEAGPPGGPLVILLHGFPEFSYGWRHQIGPLAAAGFRVVVPDQRGYGRSGKPEGIDAYRLAELGGDVIALADALGCDRFRLAGHDWGGIVAWWVAAAVPGRVERLAVLNAPHPDVGLAYALKHPGQFLRSFYVGLFQAPRAPEYLLAARDHLLLRQALTRTSWPGTFSEADLALYRAAWSEPGALAGMLNWYRALVQRRPNPIGRIAVPTRILWGRRDSALASGLADASLALCDDGRLLWYDDATHWVQHEEPKAVSAALVAFFAD